MQISLKRIDNKTHELLITRDDGTQDRSRCETRSLLKHDLTHFAVEGAAQLKTGFWGMLAGGKSLQESNLEETAAAGNLDVLAIEKVVAVIQTQASKISAQELFGHLNEWFKSSSTPSPSWLTSDTIERSIEILRQVEGRWNGTPFGEALVLEWPVDK